MAPNFVSLVTQFPTADMIGRIATALELDRNKAPSAFSRAVPALLVALDDTATPSIGCWPFRALPTC